MRKNINREKMKFIFDKGSGILPKSLFVGFAIGGAVLIWILKSIGFSQFAVVFSVACISTYCFIAYKLDDFFLTEEKIGDNAYYLGFLYTLTSLSFALLMFSNGHNTPEYIISSFGVALWSTIAGIALRVFFSQLRNDPNDVEKNARIRVAETASSLAAELHQATSAFNSYRISLQQSMEEAFIDLNKKIEGFVVESNNKIREVSETVVSNIENKYKYLDSTVTDLAESSSKASSSFDSMSKKVDICTAEVVNAVSQLTEATRNQAKETNSIVLSVNSMLSDLALLSKQIVNLKDSGAEVKILEQSLKNVSNEIMHLLKLYSTNLAVVIDEQNFINSKITDHANSLEKQLERSRQYTNDTHQALAEMARKLIEKLG